MASKKTVKNLFYHLVIHNSDGSFQAIMELVERVLSSDLVKKYIFANCLKSTIITAGLVVV